VTGVVGVGLLASAFAPIVAVLSILRWHELGSAAIYVVCACALAVLLLAFVLRRLARIQHRTVESKAVRRADDRVLAFAASYVVPAAVAVIGGNRTSTLLGAFVLIAFLALVYVRAGLYHLNPTLAIIGFRLYEVTATNGTVTMLLTRRRHLGQVGTVDCRYISSDVAFELEGNT
jgi:hypothetical protein